MRTRLISIILAAVMILAAAACTKNVSREEVIGTYKIKTIDGKDPRTAFEESLIEGGVTPAQLYKELESEYGITDTQFYDDFLNVTFKEDGTVEYSGWGYKIASDTGNGVANATWEVKGSTVFVTGKNTSGWKYKDGELTMTDVQNRTNVYAKK